REVESIEPGGRASEELSLLVGARPFRQQFAGVPEHGIAVGALVDREVALKHAARSAESLDTGRNVGTPSGRQRLGGRWVWLLMKAEPTHAHAKAPDLHVDVRASGKCLYRGGPAGKHLLVPPGISTDADRTAHMVEHNVGVREGACQVGELVDLRVVEPGVER